MTPRWRRVLRVTLWALLTVVVFVATMALGIWLYGGQRPPPGYPQ